jgi:type IV pilus assembly protein PilP
MDTRQDVGITAYVAGLLALLTVILIGIEPAVPAADPASTLLAMSLFKQDPPPPAAKPKVGLPQAPDPFVRAAPTPPAIGIPPPTSAPDSNMAATMPADASKPIAPITAGASPSGQGAVPGAAVTVPPVTPSASPTGPGAVPGAPVTALPPVTPGTVVVPGAPVTALPPVPPGGPSGPGAVPGRPVPIGSVAAIDAPGYMDGYTYDAKSRRDPFQSMVKLLKLSQTRGELPPLQRLELTDVKLIGIVSDASGYYGLIQTPDGKGYTVRVGTPMGLNNGTIRLISEQRVVVAEPTIDTHGKMTSRDIEILQRPKEGTE